MQKIQSVIESHFEKDRPQREVSDSIDAASFEAMFLQYYPALVRYARRSVSDDGISQDIVQEAFLRIWNNRQSIEKWKSIRALLYLTVRNLVWNRYRDKTRRKILLGNIDPECQPQLPSEVVQAGLLAERMRKWIAALPDRRREAFELSRYDGLTYHEIADVMGVSAKTVENHIRLALSDLRDRLRAYEPDLLRS